MHYNFKGNHLDLSKVSIITTKKVSTGDDDYIEVTITMDACLKPSIEISLDNNDIEEQQVKALVEAFEEVCNSAYE